MSCAASPNNLAERLACALNRRLYPNTALHPKQLCHAIGISESTLDNLKSGNNPPRAETLLKLIGFFDAGFGNELLEPHGCVLVKLSDARAAAAARQFDEARRELVEAMEKRP